MPELPEVETIRRALHPNLVGKRITALMNLSPKQLRGNRSDILKATIVDTGRSGKVLHLKLDNDQCISVHLKMSGQLLYAPDKNKATFTNQIPFAGSNHLPAKSTRIILEFNDGSALFFNDSRRFGWMQIASEPATPTGPDVLSPSFSATYFLKRLSQTKKPIKAVLLDQAFLAGVGNIYANDALFTAGIHPTRLANELSDSEVRQLYQSVQDTIQAGIKHKGASGKDEVFISADGSPGEYQELFQVYQREGAPCRSCNTPIKRMRQNGRSSFYCPECQR